MLVPETTCYTRPWLCPRVSPSFRPSYTQGELGDCYLLGAMSSIAAATIKGESGALLKKLIKTGSAELGLGFVTFEMYSFGEWVETTVDTLLPCDESGAHPGPNPNPNPNPNTLLPCGESGEP